MRGMESLIEEILKDLIIELGLEEASDIAILTSKVKNAYREVKRTRNYQTSRTQEFIDKDMENFYSNIRELALYDFNQVGGEGQTSHSENGTSRVWKDRKECFNGITAFCGTP